MADIYWSEQDVARWYIYSKRRGYMAQADTEDDARLIVKGLEALEAQQPAAPSGEAIRQAWSDGYDAACREFEQPAALAVPADAVALVREAADLIEGDLTGYAWRKACREFVERARTMLDAAKAVKS